MKPILSHISYEESKNIIISYASQKAIFKNRRIFIAMKESSRKWGKK
jgi:hypothetical protein